MKEYEQQISDATHLTAQAAYKQAKQDGYDENIAEYVAAQVHQAFEVGWRSALQSSINLLNKLKID